MIHTKIVDAVARALHERYEPERAVLVVSRSLQKALFAGKAEDVLFWALVYAEYQGDDLDETTLKHLDQVRASMLSDA